MGKKKQLPFVSICTPTFNRRPFIPIMLQCFKNQDYPKDRMEWIIVDDGTDKIEDLLKDADIPQIKYFPIDKKMSLGAKRNFMHTKTKGAFLVYMDDDDYYPPERVSHAVQKLQDNPQALCAGSSELYVYFKHISKMYQAGPYGPNHATAGTFAFRRELLNQTKYDDTAALAEEKEFLKNYTIPLVQLDPMKAILVFSHIQNTFDKKILLEHQTDYFKPSNKTVDMFIRYDSEKAIKQFFLNDVDKKLANYKPGDPIMKPDVLVQMKEIEKERQKLMAEQQKQGNGHVMIQQPGSEPRALNNNEIVSFIQQQQQELEKRNNRIIELEKLLKEKPKDALEPISTLLLEKNNQLELRDNRIRELELQLAQIMSLTPPVPMSSFPPFVPVPVKTVRSKCTPEVMVLVN